MNNRLRRSGLELGKTLLIDGATGTELEKRGVVTRPFSGEGIRVTIGTPDENDRFLDTLAAVADR